MTLECGKTVLQAELTAIQAVLDYLDDSFIKVLNLVTSQPERRVITCGIGKAGIIAQKISATLASTGTESIFLHPTEALHGDIGMLRASDLVLVLSNSGESDEISRLLPFLRRLKLPIVAITSSLRSTLGVQADLVLELGHLAEACPLGLAPTASTTAMLALGDAIAIALMKRRNFSVSDYAVSHPAGELGRKSFTVSEVMRGKDAIALVEPCTTIREVIKKISLARCGAAVVVDNHGKLAGIFTDGDLRRGIQEGLNFLDKKINIVIKNEPLAINSLAPAVAALKKMQENRIGELPVVDNDEKVVGVVDLKSLLAENLV